MKVWEETWEPRDDSVWQPERRVTVAFGPMDPDAARLAAAAPEMARLLLERYQKHAENDLGNDSSDWYCLACGRGGLPHDPDCRLVAVLRKAGVIE